MNIRNLILLSIGSTILPGCPRPYSSVSGCDPDTADFNINQDIVANNIHFLLEGWPNTTVEAIDCEQMCRSIIYQEDSWESQIDSCQFNLDTSVDFTQSDTGEDDQVVGDITCSGTKFEYYCEGRRPLGFQDKPAGYFARSAHLEAASVIAFLQLTKRLQGWKAPQDLIDRCLLAAQDEVRHAQVISRIAHRYGQTIPRPSLEACPTDMITMALHNATEGCIFETWAALEAQLKSQTATTQELRDIYAGIAQDEIKHAQLSWDLHQWFVQQLNPQQVQQIEQTQKQAMVALRDTALSRLQELPKELGLCQIENLDQILNRFLAQLAA